MAASATRDRINQLERIEREIANALNNASQSLQELSKDRPNSKQVETHTQNFIKTLQEVESGLTNQINYLTQVSTGQPHEGSCYAPQKDLQMAYHRIEHVKSRLSVLDKLRTEHHRANILSRSYSMPEQSS